MIIKLYDKAKRPEKIDETYKERTIIKYCQHCNIDFVGVEGSDKETSEFLHRFDKCPICGYEFDVSKGDILDSFPLSRPECKFNSRSKIHPDLSFEYDKKEFEQAASRDKIKVDLVATVYYENDYPWNPCYEYVYHNKYAQKNVLDVERRGSLRLRLNTFEAAYEWFTYNRTDNTQSAIDDKYNSVIEEISETPSVGIYSQVDSIKTDTDQLKAFIAKVVETQGSVYAVSERLKTLYKMQMESKPECLWRIYLAQNKIKRQLEEAEEIYEAWCEDVPQKSISISDIPMELPEVPVVPKKGKYPTKPSEPEYIKVNIFNKKRATAENEKIKEKYESKCRAYEEQCKAIDSKYTSELVVYDKMKAEYDIAVVEAEKIRQQKYEARIKELELETESGKKKAKAKLDRIKKKYDEAGSIVTPETVKLKIIEDEIVQAEEVLRKQYSVLNAMYECGVIFVKYRNIVACSSFSEYLESGRCARLDGADGAYNIYESETRMNMVISELSQIVESLEQIKQNQFVIYSAIKETNRLLNSIDNSMSEAISTLSDIKADTSSMNNYMKEIANNTAVSAYYSRVNAFYAKKNAELTNALGFMVAFK